MFAAAMLILIGIIMLIVARRRTPMYWLLVAAFVPLLLGVLTTYMKNREIERMLTMIESAGVEAAEAGRREAMISTYVGAAGTALIVFIGLIGLAMKRGAKS